jgi:hypothetical protein
MKKFSNAIPVALAMALLSACALSPAARNVPDSPRDLLAYYEPDRIKSLRYDDLNVKVLSHDRKDGYDVYRLRFAGFDQLIAGAQGLVKIRWDQWGILVLPPGPLATTKGIACDCALGLDDANGLKMISDISRAYGIPVLSHGPMDDVMKPVDGDGVHGTQDKVMRRLLATGVESAGSLPMDGRYLFNGNPLAKADMVATTLLQRMVERERGSSVTEIAAMGGSKEGASHWIMGALDDRIKVLAPGGYYWHDTAETLKRYEQDLGWKFPWKQDFRPDKDGLDRLFETAWRLGDWMERTEAGKVVARTTFDPASWYDEVLAKHVVVFGDLGLRPEQHDAPWAFWSENEPLSRFKHPSWRYVRMHERRGIISEMALDLLPEMAELLMYDITTPTALKYELAKREGGAATLKLQARVADDAPSEALALVGVSPERGLRDSKYWKTVSMRSTGRGQWAVDLPAPPPGHGVAVIAVVRERVQRGSLSFWRSDSTLPIEVVAAPRPAVTKTRPRWDQPWIDAR